MKGNSSEPELPYLLIDLLGEGIELLSTLLDILDGLDVRIRNQGNLLNVLRHHVSCLLLLRGRLHNLVGTLSYIINGNAYLADGVLCLLALLTGIDNLVKADLYGLDGVVHLLLELLNDIGNLSRCR